MNWFNKRKKSSQQPKIESYADFWNWFSLEATHFFQVLRAQDKIEAQFIDVISPALKQLNSNFYFVVGMPDDETAELIITADGDLQVIPYVEDLIAAAPSLPNWQFTAHKSPAEPSFAIKMADYSFDDESIKFAVEQDPDYPDEVNILLVYEHFNPADEDVLTDVVLIYLDNYLGEIRALSSIDNLQLVAPDQVEGELIDIKKLESYLIWREKEFIEKYEGTKYDTAQDPFSSFTSTTGDGLAIVAIMNTALLRWDSKASHPWMICIDINYDGAAQQGMPAESVYQHMDAFEDALITQLPDREGYLNIGRETGNNQRSIYLACKDFRLPVKLIDACKQQFATLEIEVDIFKDKYWKTLNRFMQALN